MPIEQQIVKIQHVVLLFAADVLAVQPREILFPFRTPGILLGESLLEGQPGVDAVAIDGEASILARKALVLR